MARSHVTTSHDSPSAFELPVTLIAGLVGGALLAWGANRRSAVRTAAGASGAILLASALVRAERERRRGAGWPSGRPVGVPEDRVFEFWSHYEDERPASPARRSRRHVVGSA
jgi:hypothetical protein